MQRHLVAVMSYCGAYIQFLNLDWQGQLLFVHFDINKNLERIMVLEFGNRDADIKSSLLKLSQ